MFASAFQTNAFQNTAFQVYVPPASNTTGGDGWTKEEYKRYKLLDKKLKKAEQAKIEAVRSDAEQRKQTFRDLVDPQPVVAKVKQNEVESKPKVSVDIPSIDLTKYDKDIANLERKIQDLYKANALRQAQVAIEAELAILDAKSLTELDDEEAILLLL